jgi:hypothetical protein
MRRRADAGRAVPCFGLLGDLGSEANDHSAPSVMRMARAQIASELSVVNGQLSIDEAAVQLADHALILDGYISEGTVRQRDCAVVGLDRLEPVDGKLSDEVGHRCGFARFVRV